MSGVSSGFSILEFLGEVDCKCRSGGAFLLFPLLLFSGSSSGGALRGGEFVGGEVGLLDRNFRGIVLLDDAKKFVIY